MAGTKKGSAGTKIYLSSTTGGSPTVQILGIETIDRVGQTRALVDTTCLEDVTEMLEVSGLLKGGEVKISGYLSTTAGEGHEILRAALADGQLRNVKIELNDMPNGGAHGSNWTFAAYVTGYDCKPGAGKDEKVKFDSGLATNGAITFSAAA